MTFKQTRIRAQVVLSEMRLPLISDDKKAFSHIWQNDIKSNNTFRNLYCILHITWFSIQENSDIS